MTCTRGHRLAIAILNRHLACIDAVRVDAIGGGWRCEQAAGFIEDGDAIGGQAWCGAGDEVADGADLAGRQLIAAELNYD